MMRQRDAEWHAARRTGIGGSDAPVVMGVSEWKTPFELYLEKSGDAGYQEKPQTEWMRWGGLLEPVMREEYQRVTARLLIDVPALIRHPRHEFMVGSLDARAADRIVELKTARTSQGWGEPGTDEIPMAYLLQVHHYLTVTELPLADIAVLFGASDFRIYTVEADADIAAQIVEAEAAFWRLVQQRTPPPVTSVAEANLRWGAYRGGGSVAADADVLTALERLRTFKADLKLAEERVDAEQAIIQAAMADRGDTLVDGLGNVLATWKPVKGSTYTVTRKDGRRFNLKEKK